MKNKKGFTLIELLAVIVVLAIVALITVPTVLGVVEKTKKSALKDSAYGLIEAANIYYAQYGVSKTARFDIENGIQNTEEENELSYKGNIKNGTILINKRNQVVVCIKDGKYSAYKNYSDQEIIVGDYNTCTVPKSENILYLDGISQDETQSLINSLLARIEKLEGEYAQLQSKLDNQNTSSNQNITNLQNKVGTEDISSLNGSISSVVLNHENQIEDIKTSISNKVDTSTYTNGLATKLNITDFNNSISSLILDKLYPIGSIYLETTNTNPSSKLGGTWVAYGASDTYLRLGGNGSGGSNSVSYTPNGKVEPHTLTVDEIPSHRHDLEADGYGIYINDSNTQTKSFGLPNYTTNKGNAHVYSTFTGGGAGHSHGFTGTTTTISITPKYVQVYAWKRTS